jgi:hypothetical protein
MAESLNPAAPHHLPAFITAPGETDVLMVIMAVVLVLSILGFGGLFLRLHTLPERLAHKSQKIQFEIVAVLGLIALFTHMHIFWVAGLLLALIDFPDLGSFLGRIAGSVERIAGTKLEEAGEVQSPEIVGGNKRAGEAPRLALQAHDRGGKGEGTSTPPIRSESVPARKKESSRA